MKWSVNTRKQKDLEIAVEETLPHGMLDALQHGTARQSAAAQREREVNRVRTHEEGHPYIRHCRDEVLITVVGLPGEGPFHAVTVVEAPSLQIFSRYDGDMNIIITRSLSIPQEYTSTRRFSMN